MGIGNIKNAVTGFVKDAGQKSAEMGRAMARGPVLSAKLSEVNVKLGQLKGWGPEIKMQRAGLEAERKQLMTEIEKNNAVLPNRTEIMRNIR